MSLPVPVLSLPVPEFFVGPSLIVLLGLFILLSPSLSNFLVPNSDRQSESPLEEKNGCHGE